MYETSTYLFLQLFPAIFKLQTISLMDNSPLFVQHFIGFLFIEEAVQSVAWVPGQVLINCPPPPSQIFRELVKNCMGFCCFVTIKDLPLGFLLSQKFYWHDLPQGVWGGVGSRNFNFMRKFCMITVNSVRHTPYFLATFFIGNIFERGLVFFLSLNIYWN